MFLKEPVGSSAPKFSGSDYLLGTENEENTAIRLSCPAQSFPTPSFRFVRAFVKLPIPIEFILCISNSSLKQCLQFIAPIGGSVPKFSSETDGSKLFRPAMLAISLTCPAQAYPVPTFR